MLEYKNISKVYHPNILALDNVSFTVAPHEFVCLAGKSGAGKTTLLRLLLAEEKPTKGKVFFNQQNVQDIKPKELPGLRKRIGMIFQDYKLLPCKTVYENVAYALEVNGATEDKIAYEVAEVLDIVGLQGRKDHLPAELSGGERQRGAIARALIHRPEVILADEPTGNLDPYHTLDIIKLLTKINEGGTTVVLATHNRNIINSLAKRTITLHEGKIIKDEKVGCFIL